MVWGQITKLGMVLAALMLIFPKIAGIFGQTFKPMAEAANKSILGGNTEEGNNNDKTTVKKWFIGVDDSTGYGEPATLLTGTILIPIMLCMALILPCNETLPMVGLISLPFMIKSIIALTNGNMIKVIITATMWYSAGLYMCTWTAPYYTHAAEVAGIALTLTSGALMITSFNMMAQLIAGAIFFGFLTQNPIWMGVVIVVYFICFIIAKTKKAKIHEYIERQAAKNDRASADEEWAS